MTIGIRSVCITLAARALPRSASCLATKSVAWFTCVERVADLSTRANLSHTAFRSKRHQPHMPTRQATEPGTK